MVKTGSEGRPACRLCSSDPRPFARKASEHLLRRHIISDDHNEREYLRIGMTTNTDKSRGESFEQQAGADLKEGWGAPAPSTGELMEIWDG